MILDDWAQRWNVPAAALDDLKRSLGVAESAIRPMESSVRPMGSSEAAISNRIRLEASRVGCRLWRNNVGAVTGVDGQFFRFGLANESTAVNRVIKSADLIGIRPVLITAGMVGWTIGQFLSREVKAEGWRYTGTDRERAQLNWAELILSLGGDACFTIGEGTI